MEQVSFETLASLQGLQHPNITKPEVGAVVTAPNNKVELTSQSSFTSFQHFEDIFNQWKCQFLHPFRVASSEALREPDGTINQLFKYRYVVYHCAHYGKPRMRGVGKRPNQNYLPCGCRAMLRLNYSFAEKCLKITTLNPIHNGHVVSEQMYNKVSRKASRIKATRRSSKINASSLSPPSSTGSSPGTGDIPFAQAIFPLFQLISTEQQILEFYQQQQLVQQYICFSLIHQNM